METEADCKTKLKTDTKMKRYVCENCGEITELKFRNEDENDLTELTECCNSEKFESFDDEPDYSEPSNRFWKIEKSIEERGITGYAY